MQQSQDQKLLKYYHTIEFLPVGCFYKILETGDLRYLLKLDEYDNLPECSLNLNDAWNNILKEYLDYSKDKNKRVEVSFMLECEITRLKIEFFSINTKILLVGKDEKNRDYHLKELEKIWEKIEYDSEDDLKEKLRASSKRTGTIKGKWKIKEKELERFTKKEDDNKTSFEDIVDSIELHKGFYIDIWKLTVKRWLSILKNYDEHIKQLKKHARGKNNKR